MTEVQPCALPISLNVANGFVVSASCAAGYSGTAAVAACTTPGDYSLSGCTTCAENFHVVSNECVACAAGTTRAAGDDVSGIDTDCDDIICTRPSVIPGYIIEDDDERT